MIPLSIHLDGDNCWPEMKEWIEAEGLQIAVLPGGTSSGRPSVTIRIELPTGEIVLAQTTARLFCSAGRMITSRYPDLFEGD